MSCVRACVAEGAFQESQRCDIGHPLLQPEPGMAGTVGAEMEQQQIRHKLNTLMEQNEMARFADAQIVEWKLRGIFAKKYFDT